MAMPPQLVDQGHAKPLGKGSVVLVSLMSRAANGADARI